MNAKFFSERGMSIYETSVSKQVESALQLLHSEEKKSNMLRAQQTGIPADACERICDLIMEES